MRIGQSVTLTSDLYGGSVIYHGHIAGLGIGTGSAFSLLPAQNASGNWIKIVQRLPVRITLDPGELNRHPLRIGLSMRVEADVRDESGPLLATRPPQHAALSTRVYARNRSEIDGIIAKIIRDNGGSAAVAARALAHHPRAAGRPPAG
jgi:membrane fusion protein (multidrug efflux system)